MIAAVFDLDRTLLPSTTAERIFLRYLIRNRSLGAEALWQMVQFSVRTGLSGLVQRIRARRPYLTGMHEATLRLHGEQCALVEILPQFSTRGLEFLRKHQRAGHHTVLLSGSLPYVVEPIAEKLKFDEVICSQLLVKKQRLTGYLDGLHPYGEAKAVLMHESAQQHCLNLDLSFCYADHYSDAPMLRMFGYPVCVNPSDALRQVAIEQSWRIEEFR